MHILLIYLEKPHFGSNLALLGLNILKPDFPQKNHLGQYLDFLLLLLYAKIQKNTTRRFFMKLEKPIFDPSQKTHLSQF